MSPKQYSNFKQVLLVCLIIIITFISSCSDKIKTDIIAFEALDEGLVNSNIAINNYSQTDVARLEDKMNDPLTSEKAKLWYPKAQLIQKLSEDIYIYIEGLKSNLKNEAGLKTSDGKESFKESDKNSVMRLFNKQGKGEELYQHLKKYKQDVLAIDSIMNKEFNNTLLITTMSFESVKDQGFARTFFDDIPAIAALAMLSKFQNNIKIIENKTISFCDAQVPNYGNSRIRI